jgi:hypothetical protein
MMFRSNVVQAMLFVAFGGACPAIPDDIRKALPNDMVFRKLMNRAFRGVTYADSQASASEVCVFDEPGQVVGGFAVDEPLVKAYSEVFGCAVEVGELGASFKSVSLSQRELAFSRVEVSGFYRVQFDGASDPLLCQVEEVVGHKALALGHDTFWVRVRRFTEGSVPAMGTYPQVVAGPSWEWRPAQAVVKQAHVAVCLVGGSQSLCLNPMFYK